MTRSTRSKTTNRSKVRKEALQWSKEQTFSTAMKTSPENLIYCISSKSVMASVALEGESALGPVYSLNFWHVEKDGRVTHEGMPQITKSALTATLHRAGMTLTARRWKYPVVTDERTFDLSKHLPLASRGSGGFELLSLAVTPHPDTSDAEGGATVPGDH